MQGARRLDQAAGDNSRSFIRGILVGYIAVAIKYLVYKRYKNNV